MPAKFKMGVQVAANTYVPGLLPAAVTDADRGKPVKLTATDEFALCTDGDNIYGFIDSVEAAPQGGKTFGSIQIAGRRRVELDGITAIGAAVEAGTIAAAGTAEGSKIGIVSTHLVLATDTKHWILISGTGADEDKTAVVESQ